MSKWEISFQLLQLWHIWSLFGTARKAMNNYNCKWIPVIISVVTAVLQLHEKWNSKSSRKVKVHIPHFYILFLRLIINVFSQHQTGHCFQEERHIRMLHPSDLHFQQDWPHRSPSVLCFIVALLHLLTFILPSRSSKVSLSYFTLCLCLFALVPFQYPAHE